MAMLIHQLYLGGRTAYAPIDQAALAQYPLFRKLGFYGIDLGTQKGARQFLAVTCELLQRPTTAIWITPGGRFTDIRTRTGFEPGLAHVAAAVSGVTLLPVAIEYAFWEERTPEALIEFGAPADFRQPAPRQGVTSAGTGRSPCRGAVQSGQEGHRTRPRTIRHCARRTRWNRWLVRSGATLPRPVDGDGIQPKAWKSIQIGAPAMIDQFGTVTFAFAELLGPAVPLQPDGVSQGRGGEGHDGCARGVAADTSP